MIKISSIKPNPSNPRILKDDKYKKLVQSIKDFPKMMALRPIVVDSDMMVLGGNMRLKALQGAGFKEIPNEWVKRAEDLTEEEKRQFIVKDNASAGQWDWDMLANEFEMDTLEDWGIAVEPKAKRSRKNDLEDDEEEVDPDEEFYKQMLNDCIYPSNNLYDIPTLLMEKQAGSLVLPVAPWGADSRLRKDVSTYHFYVDDYRFEAIFKNPIKVLTSGCKQLVEPNLSLYDTTPLAYGLHLIYKKRWISRYFQECNINVYADLNVSQKFYEYNQMGIPEGYNAFWTRGYSDRLKYLEMEIDIACKISGLQSPNLIVYGGGSKVKEVCIKHNLTYVEQFINNK